MANDGPTALRSALSAGGSAIRRLTRSKSKPRGATSEPAADEACSFPVNGGAGGAGSSVKTPIGRSRSASSRSIFRRSGKRGSSKSAVSFGSCSVGGLPRDGEKCAQVARGEDTTRERRHTVSVTKQQQKALPASNTHSIRQLMDSEHAVSISPVSMRRHHSVPRRQNHQQRPTLRHLAQDVIVLATNGILATPPASMFRQSPASLSPSGSPYSDRRAVLGTRVSPKTSPRLAKRGFYGSPSLNSPKTRRGSAKNSPKTLRAGLSMTPPAQGEKDRYVLWKESKCACRSRDI